MSSTAPGQRHQYRTTSARQLDDRRLLLRGGPLDGRHWAAVVTVGQRVFCGDGPWSVDGVYVVTAEEVHDPDGGTLNVAVPAFAST
jgi:hypothetical protein